jgi:hypothetical protein
MMEELTQYIANLGFPIVVALYLLVRVENKIASLEKTMDEVLKAISKLL